jgi:acetylornithine deacetylase/succinyl-diaminopimelate desuccinylase-like protein
MQIRTWGSSPRDLPRAARCAHALLCALAIGCASAPPPRPDSAAEPAAPVPPSAAPTASVAPATPVVCPRAPTLQLDAIAQEAACLLGHYVRIDTTNPPGQERRAADFLRDVLAREGIESQIIESAPGRANLIARLRGQGRGGAVVLMHHMDVVPASAAEWSVPPLSGAVRDGELWGRGSLDNKGGGVLALVTMLLAKRLATPLERDLVFLAVADEEAGGAYGARFLIERHMELFAGVEFVLNEGGAVVRLGEGRVLYSVELAQKAPLWLRLTARGRSGHGAAPQPDSAVQTLLRGLSRLSAHAFPIVVVPEVQALFAAKAAAMPEPLRAAYGDLRAALARRDFRERFLAEPRDAALVRNTLAITMLQGSDKENVIPGEASAVLDMRLLPGQDGAAVTQEVVRVLGEPGIEVTPILSWRAYASPRDTALFRAIEAFAQKRDPGAAVIANVAAGFTDCNAFRAKGITCYGFSPLRVAPDAFERIHGKDERIAVQDLAAGVIDLHALLLGLSKESAMNPTAGREQNACRHATAVELDCSATIEPRVSAANLAGSESRRVEPPGSMCLERGGACVPPLGRASARP